MNLRNESFPTIYNVTLFWRKDLNSNVLIAPCSTSVKQGRRNSDTKYANRKKGLKMDQKGAKNIVLQIFIKLYIFKDFWSFLVIFFTVFYRFWFWGPKRPRKGVWGTRGGTGQFFVLKHSPDDNSIWRYAYKEAINPLTTQIWQSLVPKALVRNARKCKKMANFWVPAILRALL